MRPDQKSPSVYLFDAPIEVADSNSETIKILVCDTQSLGQNNIETLINRIKEQKNTPIVYIFTEVNPATLASIKKYFQSDAYFIFEKDYPKSENKSDTIKLVTLFDKRVMQRTRPEKMSVYRDGQPVQSFFCKLSHSSTDIMGSSFVLHAVHLNVGNQYHHIRDVEETIRTKILSNDRRGSHPQILAGDLGIATLAGDSWTPRIAALTCMKPPWFAIADASGKVPIGDKGVDVTPFQQIDLELAQSYALSQGGKTEEKQNNTQLVLLSQFGGKHLEVSQGAYKNNYSDIGIYASNLQEAISSHLQNKLVLDSRRDQNNDIGVRLACMPGEHPLRYYLVLEIPKKLWPKLGAFMDVKGMVVQENRSDYLLSIAKPSTEGHDQMVASFKKAVESLSKYSFLEFESHISGLYVELIKQPDNSVCFKFFTKSDTDQTSLAVTQLAAINALHKLDANTDSLLKNLMSAAATVNKKFSGLVTASFLCEKEGEGASYFMRLEFVNPAIASFVRSSGSLNFLGDRYTMKPLDQNRYYNSDFLQNDGSLILPINVISGELQVGDDYLSKILSKRAEEIDGYLPFTIYSHDQGENSFTVKKLLPYALVQRFSLGKPTKGDKLFSYPYGRSLVDIKGGLFQDRFNLEAAIVYHFQNYKGKDEACLELAKISKKKANDDVLAACQDMVDHCSVKIKSSSVVKIRFFSLSESDQHTALLHQSIKNIKANFVFNCQSKDSIQTLQQLINTQEKRVLVELCKKERKSADGEPYTKIRKNSALLLLERYLILSHPAYTANDVWENIKTNPVECCGTEKNYLNESGDKELTLGEILSQVPEIQKALSLLVTSNDVVVQTEILNK